MSDDFDILKMIDTAVKSNFDSGSVTDMDDKQLNWSKNIVSWVMDAEFLNVKTVFPTQLHLMLRLFGDVCPYCSDWEFYSKDFDCGISTENILDKIQLLQDGVCPKCHSNRLQHYKEGFWTFPDEANLCWGMRSGKSAVAGMLSTYVLHRYLRLNDPSSYFDQLKKQELVMRFVARNLKQAKESNWMQFRRSVETSDWFSQYHAFLNEHGKKKGVELYKWNIEGFDYFNKGIKGYVTGAVADGSRGRTSIFSCIDEIAFFNQSEDAKQANAHDTYIAYEKSCLSIRAAAKERFNRGDFNTPTAYMMIISSTISKSDYIMRLIKQNKHDPKKVVSHKATWEVNPKIDPKELDNEKRKDPKAFMANYGSIPPFAQSPFIHQEERVLKLVTLKRPSWQVTEDVSVAGRFLDASNIESGKSIPYLLSIDMGRVDCGYVLTLLKLKEDDFSVIQVDGVFTIYPEGGMDVVDFDGMFNSFITVLCDKLLIKMVAFDQWQSQSQIDALKKRGINAVKYSLTYKDFLNFRSQLFQSKLELCEPELTVEAAESSTTPLDTLLKENPYLHLIWQLLSVSEVGTKIVKTEGYDDIFRALVLGCHILWDEKMKQSFSYSGGMPFQRLNRNQLVIAGASRSGHSYATTSSGANNYSTGNRALGAVITRGRR